MKAISSLKNRVFLASAFVAVLSIALGTHLVTVRVRAEAEAELERDLTRAAELLAEHYRSRTETLHQMAWLLADLPRLKAAVATGDGPTVEPIARDYKDRVGLDIVEIRDDEGEVLVTLGRRGAMEAIELATLPIAVGPEPMEELGTLSVGFYLDDALVREMQAITQSEIALVADRRIVAATLPMDARPLHDDDYAVREVAIGEGGLEAFVMRSRSERLSFLTTFRQGLVVSALFGILLAVILSYAVARTVTRPLGVISEAMREMTSTGDLTRKIELRGVLVDEDATLLASAFNRLTDAIAQFQREAASKERLSALGRMSTVLAHEIRNPLMIIKASLRSLRREKPSSEEVEEAAFDIDHEVTRLNRMVGDVLDFARPIKLDLQPADLNAICTSAAEAAFIGADSLRYELRLDDRLPLVVTDGERLRTALVNILANAREAVVAAPPRSGNHDADVELETRIERSDAISIFVRDRGVGIPPEDLPKIFEPYFTAKRSGTGLGLAITKNIVESLGGSVVARSRPSAGTEIEIGLRSKFPDGTGV
ncbi:MAG TPA: ATP-binding protein [Vicinamibacteria bacterium]|nr:ATP-binding protein [Vicinamibacteria bacterium]